MELTAEKLKELSLEYRRLQEKAVKLLEVSAMPIPKELLEISKVVISKAYSINETIGDNTTDLTFLVYYLMGKEAATKEIEDLNTALANVKLPNMH